jgi:hypothetical protein
MHRLHKGKYVKQIKKGANRSTATLEIIHTDICGLFSVKSVDGYDSFITFTDDYSRYGYIYPIKERSEALDKFKIFKAEVENQHDKRIKIVWFDHGGEYCRPGERAYAMGWLKLGPNVHWWIRRREGVVETAHRTHC